MTRTKKSKPGGAQQPKKANSKNPNPRPKNKRVTRSQSKGQAEAGRPSKHAGKVAKTQTHDENDDDVVAISDDVEQDQASGPATKRRKQDKSTVDQHSGQDGEDKNSALVSGIEMAFQQKRAVILGYRPEASSQEKELGKSILGDAKLRDMLYHAIVDSPLMSSAWIAQSRPTGLKGWFVFCIFTTHQEAKLAVDGLNSALNPPGQTYNVFKASLRTWKTFPVIAQHIVPAKALAPRGPQNKVDNGGYPALTAYATAVNELKERIDFQASSKVPDGPAADTAGGKSANTATTQAATAVQAPKHIKFESPTVPKQPKVASVPPISQAAPAASQDTNTTVINAVTLSELDYSEQVKYQCRYLGEIENGVPIFGCILCLERDHLWNDCPERTCVHCGEQDTHVSRACLNVKKCSKCHEKGHDIEECPSKLRRTAEDGFHCDLCGEDTHADDDCSYVWRAIIPERMPQLKKAPFLSVFCYNCGNQGHWGGDCLKPREKPKAIFDIFSAKEANKYIDSSAPIANLLGETIETARRYQSSGTGVNIRGASASQSQVDSYMAGYGQQPVQQPSKHDTISYLPSNSQAWQLPPGGWPLPTPPSYVQLHTPQQLSYPFQWTAQIHGANTYSQTYPHAHQSPLPARPATRGTDGYVQYRGAHPLPPRPPQPSRQRSQSPPARGYSSNRQRDEGYGAHSFARGQGYYDDRGAYHYNPGYDSRQPPPPPPDDDYGRRQTYHAVPPPPPEPNRGRQFGGGRYSSHR